MSFQAKEPILIVGLGGAGSRLALQARDHLGADVLLISNDQKDLHAKDSIKISTAPVINPSVQLIRGSAYKVQEEIRAKISCYSTIIIMANLAGKAGAALAPIISQICRDEGIEAMSFAIMPFKYEKNRIFSSGIALKRLREYCRCTIVIDNDALLESNPSLSPKTCHNIANKTILHVIDSLKTSEINMETSILATGTKSHDIEESLRDALKMLYNDAPPDSIKHCILYVVGEDIPVGVLSSIADITSGVLKGGDSQVNLESIHSDESNVVMLSTVQGMTKFDSYDPLGIIPQERTLDWSQPECSIDCKIDLVQLE